MSDTPLSRFAGNHIKIINWDGQFGRRKFTIRIEFDSDLCCDFVSNTVRLSKLDQGVFAKKNTRTGDFYGGEFIVKTLCGNRNWCRSLLLTNRSSLPKTKIQENFFCKALRENMNLNWKNKKIFLIFTRILSLLCTHWSCFFGGL